MITPDQFTQLIDVLKEIANNILQLGGALVVMMMIRIIVNK